MCELDLIFNFETLHAALGEMIVGGIVVETSLDKVVKGVKEQGKVEKRKEIGGTVGGVGIAEVMGAGLGGMGRGWR